MPKIIRKIHNGIEYATYTYQDSLRHPSKSMTEKNQKRSKIALAKMKKAKALPPHTVFKYSIDCQFDKKLDHATIKALIVDFFSECKALLNNMFCFSRSSSAFFRHVRAF